jgi:hypothetical protein
MGVMLNEDRWAVINFTYNPAAVAAATTVEQTVTIPGLRPGDYLGELTKPTLTAGVCVVNTRVSAADTLAITWANVTAGSIDPPAETYSLYVMRPEKVQVGSFSV